MKDRESPTTARLEEALRSLEKRFEDLSEELRYLRRGVINRLVWAIVVLALALGGKDVLQAVL